MLFVYCRVKNKIVYGSGRTENKSISQIRPLKDRISSWRLTVHYIQMDEQWTDEMPGP